MAKSVYIAFLPLEEEKMNLLQKAAKQNSWFLHSRVSDRGKLYKVFGRSWCQPEPALGIAQKVAAAFSESLHVADIKVLVEDTDEGVYINTDESGEFFSDRVRVECCLLNVPGASSSFVCESEARAIDMANDFLTTNIRESASTLDEADAIAKKWGGWIQYDFYSYEI